MKNKSYIGISFIVLLFGIWTVKELRERYQKPKLATIGKVPSFTLTSHLNKKISNETMKDKVYVVEFFFSTCPTICPVMNQNMLKIQETYYGNLDFGIISITIDPKTDTVESLKNHANNLGVKHPNWHMLTGNEDYIMNLANKGFNIFAGKNEKVAGGFEHSGFFALVDKEGNIRSRKDSHGNPVIYYSGTDEEGIKTITEDIQLLLDE
jgi:protein SCO1